MGQTLVPEIWKTKLNQAVPQMSADAAVNVASCRQTRYYFPLRDPCNRHARTHDARRQLKNAPDQ